MLRRIVELGALGVEDRAQAGQILGLLGDDRPGVGLRPDGLPDIEWVKIPAGSFLMGGEDPWEGGRVLRVELSAFEIARYPVTNRQYDAFMKAGGYTEACRDCWSEEGWAWKEEDRADGSNIFDEPFTSSNHPRVWASWYEAMAYCRWPSRQLDYRIFLPTEAQWERAARGVDGKIYPWGDEFRSTLCNSWESGIGSISPVGLFPGGESPIGSNGLGILDVAGNVREWCSNRIEAERGKAPSTYADALEADPSGPEEGSRRVARSGSWGNTAQHVRAAYRIWHSPGGRGNGVGFRLARGPQGAEPSLE